MPKVKSKSGRSRLPTARSALRTAHSALPALPPRPRDAHKGQFGYVLAVGGSRGMAGAVVMAAQSAMRAGAGKVTAAVPESLYPIVAGHLVVCTTSPLPEQRDGTLTLAAGRRIKQLASEFHVLAFGPGLGRNPGLKRLAAFCCRQVALPMVIDADGLNALAGNLEVLRRRPAATVLTPHPGEMAALTGLDTRAVQADRVGQALALAARTETVVVLKGRGTVVAEAGRYYVNTTGNPGMATGGSGDVLTGVIAALIGQGLAAFDAAALGVYIHGLAGDLARDDVGEVGLIATDIMERLPAAFRAVAGR